MFIFTKMCFGKNAAFLRCSLSVYSHYVATAAFANWPDRVIAGEWVLLVAALELLGTFGKVLISVGVSCAALSGMGSRKEVN